MYILQKRSTANQGWQTHSTYRTRLDAEAAKRVQLIDDSARNWRVVPAEDAED